MPNAAGIPIPRLTAFFNEQVWALDVQTLDAWTRALEAKLSDGAVTLTDFVDGKPERDDARSVALDGPVAVVPVLGELTKRPFFFNSGTTYAQVREQVQAALDEPQARAILLDIDSPGGAADGLDELGEFLIDAARQKPLFAFIDGRAASAAYWIATAAQTIAAPKAALVGSIGVRTRHVDMSCAREKYGVTVTDLAAPSGGYKTAGSDASPLSDRDRAYIQERLDQMYEQFVSVVAENRGLEPDAVRATQAKVFLAPSAKAAGLIDQVTSRDKFLNHIKESLIMDLSELKAKHPELVRAVSKEAVQGMVSAEALEDAQTRAASAARDSILDLHTALYGEEAARRFKAVVESGATAEQVRALAGITDSPAPKPDAEAQAKSDILAGLQAALAQGVGAAGDPAPEPAAKDFLGLAKEHAREKSCSLAAALKAVAAQHPEAYQAYQESLKG